MEPLWLVIPTEIKLVFDELETPRHRKATRGVGLLKEPRKTNPAARMKAVAATKQLNFVLVVISAQSWPNAELSRSRRRLRTHEAREQRMSEHPRKQKGRRLSAQVQSLGSMVSSIMVRYVAWSA